MKKLYVNPIDLPKEAFKNPWLFLKLYIEKGSPETYSDKELQLEQCTYKQSRSFTDLCRLIQTYFPNITVEKFAFIFIEFKKKFSSFSDENIIKNGFTMLYCPYIEAVVINKQSLYNWHELEDEVEYEGDDNNLMDIINNFEEPRYAFLNDNISYLDDVGSKYNKGGKYSFNNICKIANKYIDKIGIEKAIELIKRYGRE